MASLTQLQAYITAVERVYGNLSMPKPEEWNPPLLPGAHRGRHLWTDAVGVLSLLTLHREITTAQQPFGDPAFTTLLTLAKRLVSAVHDTLGYERDGSSRLPCATDAEPLRGGLRSGNPDEVGPYKDGQYHHHLTLWMFALNRITMASNDPKYNDLAILLAEAVHPPFFNYESGPRMVWKCSIGLKEVEINTEGDLDPLDGYVVYSILQATHEHFQGGSQEVLENELEDYNMMLARNCGFLMTAGDPWELGMTLWTAQWFFDQKRIQEVMKMNVQRLNVMHNIDHYFSQKLARRSAFREFTACMGIACVIDSMSSVGKEADESLTSCRKQIIGTWYDKMTPAFIDEESMPVTSLMYAAALVPGAFRAGYFGPEPVSNNDNGVMHHGGSRLPPSPSATDSSW